MPETKSAESYDLIVVGGGAAGFFAAISANETNPRLRILIMEQGRRVLSKVSISGGGRCNVTHACFDVDQLRSHYPRGSRELIGPFHRWQCRDTMQWFERRGVRLKVENDGRVFPVSDDSGTIVDCLVRTADRAGVQVLLNDGLQCLAIDREPYGFSVRSRSGKRFSATSLLLASGGMKQGYLKQFLEENGHTVVEPVPSLFTFHLAPNFLSGLQGVSLEKVEVSIPGTPFSQQGPLLFTHEGVSGPAIIKCSAWGARWIHDRGYRFPIRINWIGGRDLSHCEKTIAQLRSGSGSKTTRNTSFMGLPKRLWERLTDQAGIASAVTWAHLNREPIGNLANLITGTELNVVGKSMNKDEFVTCGGVSLKEVHFKTMESRIIKGLYFAGEILDIDGVTGGFNFQNAWTTARIVGESVGGAKA